ncbi:MAG: glycosyltransferase [Gemmatimonadaceae bacterium]|nr:glycosyltransferase [Gemmatimonadaceae bacterium]
MRVLVLTHNYPRFPGDPAGAFVARLARAAHAAGHETRVIAPHAPGTADVETERGVIVTRFRYAPESMERVGYTGSLHRHALTAPLVTLGLPSFLLRFRRAARRAMATFRPDLVHAHWWIPGGWIATSLAARGGVPVVVTCHGSDVRLLERPLLHRVGRRVLSRAASVTTVSHFLARDLARLVPDLRTPITVTPMPLDVDRFAAGAQEPKADPPRVLYAGNLVPSKGVDVLVRAVAILVQRGIACQLQVLGEGPERPALQALAASLGLTNVEWSSFLPQSEMPAAYGRATVTVLPSRGHAEGLGLTLVEALLAGCAVVGTPAGGIPEVVQHEETGLLARDGDAEDLATQIGRLITDPALRTRLTRAGRDAVRRVYAPETAAGKIIALYETIRGHRDAA